MKKCISFGLFALGLLLMSIAPNLKKGQEFKTNLALIILQQDYYQGMPL